MHLNNYPQKLFPYIAQNQQIASQGKDYEK